MPAARRFFCADAWAATAPRRARYRLIVSNPPVHRGRPDDLRVLLALLEGGAARLRPRGLLVLVTQAHVPVGPLAAGVRRAADLAPAYAVTAERADDGRFIVWFCEALP